MVWFLVNYFQEVNHILGENCVLRPSFFAWSLKPAHKPGNNNDRIGQSFGLPHRDYPASEAMFDDGKTPKLLNVWIPVNDATLENGCMYMVYPGNLIQTLTAQRAMTERDICIA